MVLSNLVAVLTNAANLFLVAAGLNMVFGLLRVINVTHGSFYMYGAFVATTMIAMVASQGSWTLLLAIPASIVVGALALVIEVLIIRPLYGRDHLTQLLVTYGAFLVLDDVSLHLWGSQDRNVTFGGWLGSSIVLEGVKIPVVEFFMIGVTAVLAACLWYVTSRRSIGKTLQALAEDRELLSIAGVNVKRIYTIVFVLSAAVAGLAGSLVLTVQAVGPGLDVSILVEAFVVSVIGGLGSISGAAIGAILIAAVEQLSVGYAPSLQGYVIYALMLGVLVVRPVGLFGKATTT